MTAVPMNFKTDKKIKDEFNTVAQELGLTSLALLNIFVTRVAKEKAIPFKVEVLPDKSKLDYDEESKKEMIRQLAIENGLLPDDDRRIGDIDKYFKELIKRN